MLEPISTIEAIKIVAETTTKGSAPLLIMGNDDNTYFAKTTTQNNPSCEIVNKLLCAYFAKCWSLSVPEFCLVQIPDQVVEDYLNNFGKLSEYYKESL